MYERDTPPSTSAATGSTPAERVMRIAPMDLKQQRFRTELRGFNRTEVVAFLTEAADDYENALREIDRLRQDLVRSEALLAEHREREVHLRNTLLTAQRLADDIKGSAQHEATLIVREAQGRADLIIQKAQGRLEEVERDITELRLRRRDVEGSLNGSIQALQRALDFIREQDRADDRLLLHRPRPADTPPASASTTQPVSDPTRAAAPESAANRAEPESKTSITDPDSRTSNTDPESRTSNIDNER